MARKQFTFYAGFMDGISRIRNKSARCDAYDSIVKYALEGIEPDLASLPDAAAIAFVMAKPNIDASRRRADNAKKSNDDRTSIETASNEHRNESKPKQEKEQEKEKDKEQVKEQVLYKADAIVTAWNSLGLSQVTKIASVSPRGKMLKARIAEHGEDAIFKAIDNIRHSSFLRGQNDRGWTITFDWFVKPSNFTKVLEGNYADKTPAKVETRKGVPYGGQLDPGVVKSAYLRLCEEMGEDAEVTA